MSDFEDMRKRAEEGSLPPPTFFAAAGRIFRVFGGEHRPALVNLASLEAQLTRDVEQIKKQQVHIDEIKRLCHVR